MERLTSIEQYKELLLQYKQICRRGYTNNFLNMDMVSRYITLERIYYVTNKDSLFFLTDEEKYYRLYMQVSLGTENLDIQKQKKPVLIRNIFRKDTKPEALLSVERCLESVGFKKMETTAQVQIECRKVLEKQRKIEKYKQLLVKDGYVCVSANEDMLDSVEELFQRAAFIKDYHFEYLTVDEKRKEIEKGLYLCIVNREKQICAASIATVRNGIAEGVAIAVDEQYKMGGFAPVLSYERCKRLHEQQISYLNGWIIDTNEASMKHHRSMGYQFTGRYADEWILK